MPSEKAKNKTRSTVDYRQTVGYKMTVCFIRQLKQQAFLVCYDFKPEIEPKNLYIKE